MHVSFATIKATTSKHHFETDKNGVHSPPGSKSILADNWAHPDKQKLVYLNSKDWLIDLLAFDTNFSSISAISWSEQI